MWRFNSLWSIRRHQYEECQFRILQCQNCFKEILFKDFQIHQNEFCLLKELICLKCSTVYYKKEEHTQKQCLQKQISVIQQNIDQSGINSKKINENLEKLIQSYNKLLANEDYLQKLNKSEEEENCKVFNGWSKTLLESVADESKDRS